LVKELKYPSCKERLRELGWAGLEKRRLMGILSMWIPITWWEGVEKINPDCSQRCPMKD